MFRFTCPFHGFFRFKHFISDSVEPFRNELVDFLYPMFVHIYLELVGNGQKIPGMYVITRTVLMSSEILIMKVKC